MPRKRPKVTEDIDEHVRRIHKEYTDGKAGSFQEALETVTQLAEEEIAQLAERGKKSNEIPDDSWYPGKYAGMVVDSILNDESSTADATSTVTSQGSPRATVPIPQKSPPERTAVFKSYLQEGTTLSVPGPEADSIGASEDDLLQVIAFQIPGDTGEQ